jgi:hypothetical protein
MKLNKAFNELKSFKQSYLLIVIVILIAAVSVRLVGISGKQSLSYDESNSFLSVTINNAEYSSIISQSKYPFNSITSVKEWKGIIYHIKNKFNFPQLFKENNDNVGPLYYSLLHIVFVLFGVNRYNGLFLNLMLFVILYIYLYKLCKMLFGNESIKTLYVLLMFSFSYAAMQISFEARQHLLLALLSLVLFYYILKWMNYQEFSWNQLLFLYFIMVLGNLSLITFLFIVSGIIYIYFVNTNFNLFNKNLWKLFSVFLLSILSSEMIYPFFTKMFSHSTNYKGPPLSIKIKVVLYALGQYVSYNKYIIYAFLIFLFVLMMKILFNYIKKKEIIFTKISFIHFFWIYGFVFMATLYFLNKIPQNAVGEQYYMFIWFFFTISLVDGVTKYFNSYQHKILMILSAIIFFSGIYYMKKSWYLQFFVREKALFYRYIDNSDLVIIYNTSMLQNSKF